ncbi:DUF3870 domain-containing protein [Bacillus sp. mrc49]|uniref:DUF3870 domain-containing protein n=1 Tax=Bacillus sp. mrc49 TaxID=2054913 RepID=UPI0012FE06F7
MYHIKSDLIYGCYDVCNGRRNKIVDVECSTTLSLTTRFIHYLLSGKSILQTDELEEEIKRRYFGSSQKALTVA